MLVLLLRSFGGVSQNTFIKNDSIRELQKIDEVFSVDHLEICI